METITKKIGNAEYVFCCDAHDTRSGFAHTCTLYRYGTPIKGEHYGYVNEEKRYYYNRTWEAYRYQSVMLGCVNNEMNYIVSKAIDDYKAANGIKRLAKGRKDEVVEAVKNSKEYGEMKLLYDMVKESRYGTEAERERLEALDKLIVLARILVDGQKVAAA